MSWFSSCAGPVLLVCAAISFAIKPSEGNVTEVTYLVRDLMQRYEDTSETFLLPLGKSGFPLEVGIHWYPTNILSFNERDQFIEMRGYMTMEWHDPALQWNTESSEITDLSIPIDSIWRPILVLQESQTHEFESVFYENNLAFVHRDGTVSWSSDVKTSTFCQVLQRNFPYDQQVCTLTFSSAVHYQKELVFSHLNATTPDKSISNGAWEALNVRVPDCPNLVNLKNRTAIRFVVELKRRRQRYYVVTLIIPCFILSAFTSLVFLYPRAKEQRFPLATMNLLTLFVFQELISSVGPPTGSSLLGTFVFITMLEAAATTVLSILSDRLSLDYPLLPCHSKSAQNEEENKDKQTTSWTRLQEVTTPDKDKQKTSDTQLTTPDPSMGPSPTPSQEDNGCDSAIQLDEITPPESSSIDPSPTSGQGDKECDSKETQTNQTSDETYQHHCIKDVRRFDRTVVLVLFCLKCIVCFTFAVMFGSADDSAVDIIQCMDEYYFP